MHPNLTKGFGMIGPKDFFPLLDFAFMPNNSLLPRYTGSPSVHPNAGCAACKAVLWGEDPGLHSPCALSRQPAGAAAAALPSLESAGIWRKARDRAAHLLPLLPLTSYAKLPSWHEKRGEL